MYCPALKTDKNRIIVLIKRMDEAEGRRGRGQIKQNKKNEENVRHKKDK